MSAFLSNVLSLSIWVSSGGDPCLAATAEPEEQGGEQAGEHRPKEDPHGSDAGGPGTGAGGGLLGQQQEGGRAGSISRARQGR